MDISIRVPLVTDIQAVGAALGRLAQPGDMVMLNGPLGAGKTTMTQGIARGLGVKGKVSSPTFVIAQIHHGATMDLVHVDAYRLGSIEELDALDLDTSLDVSLTVVEWGAGKVETLSGDRLEITIERPEGAQAGLDPEDLFMDAPRTLSLRSFGARGDEFLKDLVADADVAKLITATEQADEAATDGDDEVLSDSVKGL
ncbi:tRNA (adenosine(37)-N6)-threonylcarbamoyltransferase complex ATPase subunit type 1 TsaE [Arcanobacterium bovis]|uniref:tRNA threonylcarbamoyladenosine biosynthesis protein TsaE n=1 Tax=Arcanobacterium bovis TaxID=2529275 RepID=A0A4Q9V0N1_9ACTO|nr:tRNA (adenosine(37)-N6)-threonylcarbamoyltransferase complex ATPase subunit type 1 TsaE [Arcanobacterium bovis]TBW22219.1 tRNA (adenosine(37)-N6)-threonylcarbamoyltransferase complex ATPase subunit type 1 TsaE [Arcanobacterium bovis]